MKKLILSLAVISALSVGAFAQKSGNKGGKRDFNPEKMATNESRRKEGMRKGRGGKHAGPHHGARPENKG